ncbi:DUF1330 domain-containing protein [Paraburkholderia ferrariae]|uniref:DUF1330 domain-containing protein n=1 Tax=Paraburkholderia ferrariae TaxID=386056 RepID=UPI000482722C|nr:DUF1330 domain-containing protein [Paraburkholderia ferrariae]
MAAYVLVDVEVFDAEAFAKYRKLGVPTIAAHGGRVLARSDEVVVLEGEWSPSRMVVLEFDDLEAARRWHGSAEYQAARRLRIDAADTRSIALASLAT